MNANTKPTVFSKMPGETSTYLDSSTQTQFADTVELSNKSNAQPILISQVLTPDICKILANYALLKEKIQPNRIKNNDPLKNVHREYGDLMMETLLEQFTPIVEKATGLKLWPTLSFYYTYKNGNELKKHKDRSCCQFVAGICIGADDDYINTHTTWPIFMQIDDKSVAMQIKIGDMLIFKGHEIEHWREPFTGKWFISAIFGYVDQNGPFAFQKYDQRKALGTKHIGMFKWLYGCLKNKLFGRRSL